MVYAKKPVTKLKRQYEEKMNIYDIAKKANDFTGNRIACAEMETRA